MGTTREDIKTWLVNGKMDKDLTHMIVVCDTFDHEDYPVYVKLGESVREVYDKHDGRDMQKIMEVYSYSKNLEEQLNEGRAFHFD